MCLRLLFFCLRKDDEIVNGKKTKALFNCLFTVRCYNNRLYAGTFDSDGYS